MSALSIRLPESLHKHAKIFAATEGVSMNTLISSALAEKLSALAAEDYLNSRAVRGSRVKFEAALDGVPATPPEQFDAT